MLPEQGAIMDHAPSQTPPRLLLTGLLFLIVAAIGILIGIRTREAGSTATA